MKVVRRKNEYKSEDLIRFRTFTIVSPYAPFRMFGKVVAATELVRVDPVTGEMEFNMQFAFCSPKDQYNRAKGRLIAFHRMKSDKAGLTAIVEKGQKLSSVVKRKLLSVAHDKGIEWMGGVQINQIR